MLLLPVAMELDLEAFLMNCTEFFLAIFSTTDATDGPLTGPDVAETSATAATASAFWMESSALFSLLVTVTLALTCSALTSGSGSLVLVVTVGGLGAGAFFLAVPVAADDLDAAPPGGVESL